MNATAPAPIVLIAACWCIALVSCTQSTPDSLTSSKQAVVAQPKDQIKTAGNTSNKLPQEATLNGEGILLSQADTDGDDLPESIVVCETASICINHPSLGMNRTYTHPTWQQVVLLGVQDTDGEKGSELVVIARTREGALACVCIIHDRSHSIASYGTPQWATATVKAIVDTNGEPGDEVVLVAYNNEGQLQCVCIIRDRDGTFQPYSDLSWATAEINWVEDLDTLAGAEVIVEARGHYGTTECICVIHHKQDQITKYSDPQWKTAAVQMLIDTDGKSGTEMIVIATSERDGSLSIIHDQEQSVKTITFTGDAPVIQQVGNYDKRAGAELCVLLTTQHTYELINDRSGERVKVDSCMSEHPKGQT